MQLKNDFLPKQAKRTDGSTTEKQMEKFHQIEKEISFLHDGLNSENTVISL